MSEKITAMIEQIKGLTVLELSELVHALEETFGVSAAAVAAGPADRASGTERAGASPPYPPGRPPGTGIWSIARGLRDWWGWRRCSVRGPRSRQAARILGVRTSFILKRAAGCEAVATVGVLHAAPTSSCCGRCAAFSS